MKKIYAVLTLALFAIFLVACNNDNAGGGNGGGNNGGGDNGDDKPTAEIIGAVDTTINVGDDFDPKAGVTAKDRVTGEDLTNSIEITGTYLTNTKGVYTITYTVVGSDGKEVSVDRKLTVQEVSAKVDIVIMHGAPYEVDPFRQDYTGKQQAIRQQLQRQAEEKYNVRVRYIEYPSNAPWGNDRVQAIINASRSGNPMAHIYWTTSDWTQALVSGNAIVPVDQYLSTIGKNISEETKTLGTFKEKVYAFQTGKPTVENGLFFNDDLLEELGIENPAQLFLDGEWTWSKFEAWAKQAQTKLAVQGDDYAVLGGNPNVYAQYMVPLNGGTLINRRTLTVGFAQKTALDTYDFLVSLWEAKLFETSGQYDAGSPAWQAGKVLMHPGALWFKNADNRWKNLNFDLGFVPYPRSDSYKGKYVSPVSGVAVYNLAAGYSADIQELAFKVWNEIQIWQTDEEFKNEFEDALIQSYNKDIYIDAILEIYDKAELELIFALGIGTYDANSWFIKINNAIKGIGDSPRAAMESILPTYNAKLEELYK